MKLRIKGNSLRLRLTKPEVEKICNDGYLEDKTSFGKNDLTYVLKKVNTESLDAELSESRITVNIPSGFIKDWYTNDVVGFSNSDEDNAGKNDLLQITVEKDFKCLERSSEDQSDNYENPNKTC